MDANHHNKTAVKSELHPRNVHKERYDFEDLCTALPDLSTHIVMSKYDEPTIDFSNADAVKCLNQALLKHHYDVNYWELPKGYLCPPIPSRADYIHNIADLLANDNGGVIPTGKNVKIMDIGVGANCIYPLLGHQIYGWQFVGSDIDAVAVDNACQVVAHNNMRHAIIIRKQSNKTLILQGIVGEGEKYDALICNPPFHSSPQEVTSSTQRKWRGLDKKDKSATLNFGGQNNELWCKGGERVFIEKLVNESKIFGDQIRWFSTLVSKEDHLAKVYKCLQSANATEVKTMEMGQGHKKSRIVAWRF